MTYHKVRRCKSIAEFMYEEAESRGMDKERCQELFTLGFLHDVGYQFTEAQEEHNKVGGLVLKRLGYKYWEEVYYHGSVCDVYESTELDLLNMADLNFDSAGNFVGVKLRLSEIKERCGENSKQYKDAVELAKSLNLC